MFAIRHPASVPRPVGRKRPMSRPGRPGSPAQPFLSVGGHVRSPVLALVLLAAASGCRENGGTPTGPEPPAAAVASAATAPLAFVQLSTSSNHTCAVTGNNVAYCWGSDAVGD